MSNTTNIANFVALSSLLTGIAASKLSPLLDPTNIKTTYYDYANTQDPAAMTELLQIFTDNKGKSNDEIAAAIFGSSVAWFARSVMLEWYLGSWYTPDDLQAYAADPSIGAPGGTVISSAAYTSGWAWNVAQAHPMGYSNFRFGYWSADPPSLQDFVGGGKS
jgi:hypothetical protein